MKMTIHLKLGLLISGIIWISASCDKSNPIDAASITQTLQREGFANEIVSIQSVVPGGTTEDMVAMKPFLENRTIVGLGESTHGTKEFYTYRHRMIRYMVEQLGFRVIGLESNFSSTQIINDYIAGGSGTALSAIKANGYWIYDTKEFLDLIEWLRTYNNGKTASDKVSFYGFDAQKAAPAATAVQAYITTLDPTYLTTFNSVAEPFLTEFEELDQYSQDQLLKLLPELITKYTAKWNTIRDYLTSNKAKLVAQVGERTFALIEQHWKIVQLRFIQMSKLDELEGFNYRDNYMAENIGWIQQFEGNKKMILMAHAGHSGNSNATGTQMGYLLKKTYQDKYYSVGFFFNEGSVRAGGLINGQPQLGEFKTPAKSEHVITKAFANGGWSQFFLSFSSIAGKPSLVDVFNKEYDIYFIGADMENVTVKQTLGKFYDGIVFLEKVNGTTPN